MRRDVLFRYIGIFVFAIPFFCAIGAFYEGSIIWNVPYRNPVFSTLLFGWYHYI